MKKAFKIIFGLIILALIINTANKEQIIHGIWAIPWLYLVFIVLAYALGQILSAYKWQLILNTNKIKSPFANTLQSYFTGMFVNSFGLGLVGGDLARALLVSEGKTKLKSIASVFADRIHGLSVLALIACMTALFWGNTWSSFLVYIVLPVIIFFIVLWFFLPVIREKFFASNQNFNKVFDVVDVLPRRLSVLLKISILSCFFHVLQIFLHWFILYIMGFNISWQYLLLAIPLVNILTSLPISWNGLGVREAAYIYFFGNIMTSAQAVILGAVWLFAVTVNSVAGGIIAYFTGQRALLKKIT